MKLTVKITGTHPMLMHNGRLANPIDPWTRQLKALTGKRKKTDEDLYEIARVEARAGCWETTDGLLGVPSGAVWRCFYDSAKQFKLGTTVKKSLYFDDIVEPLTIDGAKVHCDDFVADFENVDYRSVKIQSSKVMRARTKIPVGWETIHSFELFDDVLDVRDLQPVLTSAGRLYGLGDWRPTYGRFTVDVI
jgi:hypothetical protein